MKGREEPERLRSERWAFRLLAPTLCASQMYPASTCGKHCLALGPCRVERRQTQFLSALP